MRKVLTILLLLGLTSAMSQTNLVTGEYFFDSDPGTGNGIPIPGLISGQTIDHNFNIDVSSLPLGTHMLGMRLQDDNGDWTLPSVVPIFVLVSDFLVLNSITALEYFIDSDPGVGNGTSLVVPPGTTFEISDLADASSLGPGMHMFYVRSLNNQGEWSIAESIAFYVRADDPFSISSIIDAEYFFDSDPGLGNGTSLNITSSSIIDISQNIDVSSLSLGYHTFNLRLQSADGDWSVVHIAPFFIQNEISVTQLEYFVDNDPGLGSGTAVGISLSNGTIDLDFAIPTASLPIGPHTFNARIGENSEWGITETAPFVLCDGAIALFSSDRVCEGEVTNFNDLSTNVLGGDIYSWDFDGDNIEDDATPGDVSFTYPGPGVYSSILTIDRLGCPGIGTITTIVDTLVTLSGNVSATVEYGMQASLSGSATGSLLSSTWSSSGTGTFSDANALVTEYQPSIQDGVNGSVLLTLSAQHPGTCAIQDIEFTLPVTLPSNLELEVYNAVSPNGDGKHDFLEIENIEAFPGNRVVIFNRWGDVVQILQEYNNETNRFEGGNLTSGTYFYEIDLGNGADLIKGSFTLNIDE